MTEVDFSNFNGQEMKVKWIHGSTDSKRPTLPYRYIILMRTQ